MGGSRPFCSHQWGGGGGSSVEKGQPTHPRLELFLAQGAANPLPKGHPTQLPPKKDPQRPPRKGASLPKETFPKGIPRNLHVVDARHYCDITRAVHLHSGHIGSLWVTLGLVVTVSHFGSPCGHLVSWVTLGSPNTVRALRHHGSLCVTLRLLVASWGHLRSPGIT